MPEDWRMCRLIGQPFGCWSLRKEHVAVRRVLKGFYVEKVWLGLYPERDNFLLLTEGVDRPSEGEV